MKIFESAFLLILAAELVCSEDESKTSGVELKSLSEVVAAGEERGDVVISPMSGSLEWVRVGGDGVDGPVDRAGLPAKVAINHVSVENGSTIIWYTQRDVIGSYQFKHVPEFPAIKRIASIGSLDAALRALGKPIVTVKTAEQNYSIWGFFRDPKERQVDVMVIFLEHALGAGKPTCLLGEGIIKQDPDPGSVPSD